jgi:hypothetical protein
MLKKLRLLSIFCASALLLSFFSCNKFEHDQTVPSYIRIDSIGLNTDYFTYGANTHKITDAWIYVDDQIVGGFELPATIPILQSGTHKLTIYGGIKVNGIAAARAPYSFYTAKIYEAFELFEDSIISINPVLSYYGLNSMNVRWIEDFENGTISIGKTSSSDTSIYRVGGEEAYSSQYSSFSGKVALAPDDSFTIATSKEFADLPSDGSACMLEMDYNCSDTFFVGMYYKENNTITELPLVAVGPTDAVSGIPNRWNKIYINLGPNVVEYNSADYFEIYMTRKNVQNETKYYYFDNLKLLYRK